MRAPFLSFESDNKLIIRFYKKLFLIFEYLVEYLFKFELLDIRFLSTDLSIGRVN